jgi:hypothetical protein
MEPRALVSGSSTPFKDPKDKERERSEIDQAQRALSELSINKGNPCLNFFDQRYRFHNNDTER